MGKRAADDGLGIVEVIIGMFLLALIAVAILPALLLIVFGAIWFYDKSKGGFKATKIS